MDKVFHIRTFRSPNGAYREVELDLPATDYELFDLMEQLQLNDPNRIYLEIHPVEEYGYLDQRIQEPGLFQLNALAKRLAELDTHGMAAFEGLAAMDLQKGVKTIPAWIYTRKEPFIKRQYLRAVTKKLILCDKIEHPEKNTI